MLSETGTWSCMLDCIEMKGKRFLLYPLRVLIEKGSFFPRKLLPFPSLRSAELLVFNYQKADDKIRLQIFKKC